jgi:predicted dehydrogenase
MSLVKVGIVGLGRSGWNIHAAALQQMEDLYQVVAVTDLIEARRNEAVQALGCRAYTSVPEMLADPDVELVVVASPSYLHCVHTIQALEAGKKVVCEKPMAARLADVDSMIAATQRPGSLLTLFQNRRYDPGFLKIREVLASGKLGRIVEIKISAHGFGRRWDWQTIRGFGGGQLRNNGVHFLDHALELMACDAPEVYSHIERTLALGDAEDYVKVILRAPGAPMVDLEMSPVCAYPQDLWLILGTQGTLSGAADKMRWKYFLPQEAPQRRLNTDPTPDRSYNSDKLTFYEETWSASAHDRPANVAYYTDLYRALRQGGPLPVTPTSVRRVMSVIEKVLSGN